MFFFVGGFLILVQFFPPNALLAVPRGCAVFSQVAGGETDAWHERPAWRADGALRGQVAEDDDREFIPFGGVDRQELYGLIPRHDDRLISGLPITADQTVEAGQARREIRGIAGRMVLHESEEFFAIGELLSGWIELHQDICIAGVVEHLGHQFGHRARLHRGQPLREGRTDIGVCQYGLVQCGLDPCHGRWSWAGWCHVAQTVTIILGETDHRCTQEGQEEGIIGLSPLERRQPARGIEKILDLASIKKTAAGVDVRRHVALLEGLRQDVHAGMCRKETGDVPVGDAVADELRNPVAHGSGLGHAPRGHRRRYRDGEHFDATWGLGACGSEALLRRHRLAGLVDKGEDVREAPKVFP